MNELERILNGTDLSLLGYAGPQVQEMLLGALNVAPPAARAAAFKRITAAQNAGGANLSPRDQAVLRVSALPVDIQQGLAAKRLQMVDHTIFVNKLFAAATSRLEMFKSDDDKGHGVANIAKAQLDKDQWFLLTGVRVTSAVSATLSDAAFGIIAKAIANGDFEMKANGGKYVFPKDSAMSRFDTTNKTNVQFGEFPVSNPKWLEPGADITFDISTSQATVANTCVKVELIGVTVYSA